MRKGCVAQDCRTTSFGSIDGKDRPTIMNEYHKIVVGIDFSPACRAAFQTAARFASYHGGNVTALHVISPAAAAGLKRQYGWSEPEFLENMRERLCSFIKDFESGVLYIEARVEVGQPVKCLNAMCERLAADLLVLGTRGTEHQPNQIGTTAAECVRKAPVDVLLAREDHEGIYTRVLACVDFSRHSEAAVRHARAVAEKDNAALDCLFVFQSAVACFLPHDRHLPLPEFVASNETFESWKCELDRFLAPQLSGCRRIHWQAKVMERGSVPAGICEHVQERKVDLVVLGRSRKMAVRTLAIGTAAEEIVRHSSCSVLVVNPWKISPACGTFGQSLPNSVIAEKLG